MMTKNSEDLVKTLVRTDCEWEKVTCGAALSPLTNHLWLSA